MHALTPDLSAILMGVQTEMAIQSQVRGGHDVDVATWVARFTEHAGKAFMARTPEDYRTHLIELAALAVSAVIAHDETRLASPPADAGCAFCHLYPSASDATMWVLDEDDGAPVALCPRCAEDCDV